MSSSKLNRLQAISSVSSVILGLVFVSNVLVPLFGGHSFLGVLEPICGFAMVALLVVAIAALLGGRVYSGSHEQLERRRYAAGNS